MGRLCLLRDVSIAEVARVSGSTLLQCHGSHGDVCSPGHCAHPDAPEIHTAPLRAAGVFPLIDGDTGAEGPTVA